ncbi:MAG: tetratricopeptide repeat protein, partial [Acidithiobacillales bacterium]
PVSHLRYSNLLACLGRVPEAITEAKRAIDLDPLFSRAWGALGLCLIASDQLPEARKALSRAMEISPEDPQPHFYLAFISLLEGSPQAALQGFARIEDLAGRAMAEHDLGHAKESQQALDELIAKRASTFAFAGEIAGVYAWRGEKDKAFEWLDRAVAQHEEDPGTVKFDPQFSKLRDDPRYAALLKKVGLPAGS